MNEFRRLINIVSKNDSNRVLTENKDERKSAVNDATATAERMIERYRDSNYTAYERAGDHAMSYDRDHPHQKYWLDVQNEINRIENEQKGVTEGSEGTLWRVERSEATGRYYVVKGYNKSRKIWKNKMGVGDFVDRKSAESKADELNKGVTEAKSPEEFINQLKSLAEKQPRITNTCRVCGKKWQLQHHCKGPSKNQDKGVAEEKLITQHKPGKCTQCGGPSYDDEQLAEEKDACYRKVKSRYRVWPSAYGSGALVKCRRVGAKNWGNKSKKK